MMTIVRHPGKGKPYKEISDFQGFQMRGREIDRQDMFFMEV